MESQDLFEEIDENINKHNSRSVAEIEIDGNENVNNTELNTNVRNEDSAEKDAETEGTESTGKASCNTKHSVQVKLAQLPSTRVRFLMKLDPDLHLASNEAIFAVTRATELFIESLAREAFAYTTKAKKKTLQKRDVDTAAETVDSLIFLDGIMNM